MLKVEGFGVGVTVGRILLNSHEYITGTSSQRVH